MDENDTFRKDVYSIIISDIEDRKKILKIQELLFEMKVKEFDDYEKACEFRDEVDGQTYWTSCEGKQLWDVWY